MIGYYVHHHGSGHLHQINLDGQAVTNIVSAGGFQPVDAHEVTASATKKSPHTR